MALITCVNCGGTYSDTLEACPHCHYVPFKTAGHERGSDEAVNRAYGFALSEGQTFPPDSIGAAYDHAVKDMENAETVAQWEALYIRFHEFQNYKDAHAKSMECKTRAIELKLLENRESIYNDTVASLGSLSSSRDWEGAMARFNSLGDYKDSLRLAKECLIKMEETKKEEAYQAALNNLKNSKSPAQWRKAAEVFELLGDYRDAKGKSEYCIRQSAKRKKMAIILSSSIFIVLAMAVLWIFVISPLVKYEQGKSALANAKYAEAIEVFSGLGDYKDASDELLAAYYNLGDQLFSESDFIGAAEAFRHAQNYSDAKAKVELSKKAEEYQNGVSALNDGEYMKAVEFFTAAGDYSDAAVKISESYYAYGEHLLGEQKYVEAAEAYNSVRDYSDAIEKISYAGHQLIANQDYEDAVTVFSLLSDTTSGLYVRYAKGMSALMEGDYLTAIEMFRLARSIEDCSERYAEANYMQGQYYFNYKNYFDAKSYYVEAGDFKDASYMITVCDFLIAEHYMTVGYLNSAKNIYESLPEDFIYNDISVTSRIALLDEYSVFVKMCGKWKATGDCPISTRQVDSYGWTQWTSDNPDPNEYIIITCVINSDGTVTVSGKAQYTYFTNFSMIKYDLTVYSANTSFTVTLSAAPSNTNIADNVVLTFSKGKFVLKYSYRENNLRFKSTYTYSTKVEDY